jgi:serine/threonine protein kinase
MAGESVVDGPPRSFVDITGTDQDVDDALLASLPDVIEALDPLLSSPALLDERADVLARTYQRWRRRARSSQPGYERSEICGALGFALFTQRVLRYARERPASGSHWQRIHRELNLRFRPDEVKDVFDRLYGFPGEGHALATAEVHRIGTTSFILKCLPSRASASTMAALKCLIYPYTRMEAIAGVTRDYAREYGRDPGRPCPQMVEVYRSTERWVLMRFVDGRSLSEVLRDESEAGDEHPLGLRADRLRRYGLPLLHALSVVPRPHLDLSPSNVMVETPDDDEPTAPARLVLVDFGQNYLLTHDVAGGRVHPETTRYVAPELLGSRASSRPLTGYEDVYSVGQILLELAGYGRADGAFIPSDLFMEAPLVARLIEDLLDNEPVHRLLLIGLDLGPSIVDRREAAYHELRSRLDDALKAHRSLARSTPSLVPRPRPDPRWYRRAGGALAALASQPAQLRSLAADFPADRIAARALDFRALKFLKFLQVARTADGLSAEFRPFFRWALVCSAGWTVVWAVALKFIHDDTQQVSLLPDVHSVIRASPPFVDLGAVLHHYAPLPRAAPPGWENLPVQLVALTFGLTVTRYYLEIFSMLRLKGTRRTPGVVAASVLMRMMALGGVAVTLAYPFFISHWLLYWGLLIMLIVANNLANYRVADSFVRRGEQVFSTLRRSDLHRSVDSYAEWWRLMMYYGIGLWFLDWTISTGFNRDVLTYAALVMAINMLALYLGNCGKKAPGLRATLSRAFVTGERLDARERRLSAWRTVPPVGVSPAAATPRELVSA